VEKLVTLAAQTISRNKLIIGIPTYGYEYQIILENGITRYFSLWPFNPGYATEIATRLGITPTRNSAGEIGFAYDTKLFQPGIPTGDNATQLQQTLTPSAISQSTTSLSNSISYFNYISWSDAEAIKAKVDLAKKLGVRGVAIFKFDGGEDPNIWNVLK